MAKVIACESEDLHVAMASRSLEKVEIATSVIEAAGTKGLLATVRLMLPTNDRSNKPRHWSSKGSDDRTC